VNEPGTVSNREARSVGAWQTVGRSGVIATHAALLHTGEVVFFTRPEDPNHNWSRGGAQPFPNSNGFPGDDQRPPETPDVSLSAVIKISGPDVFKPVPIPVVRNPFCAGLTHHASGALVVAGGDKKNSTDATYHGVPPGTKYGLDGLRYFVPGDGGNVGVWQDIGEISDSRWYPTCTLLPDGRVFVISGNLDDQYSYNNQNPTCEILSIPPRGTSRAVPQYLPFLVESWPHTCYPFVFVLPSGKLFVFVKDRTYYMTLEVDHFGRERWTVDYGAKLKGQPPKQYPSTATAVLLPLLPSDNPRQDYASEVLLIGGGGSPEYPHWDFWKRGARNGCFRLKADSPDGEWQPSAPMLYPRVMPDAVLLPDGSVLVVNGVSKGYAGGNAGTGPALPGDAVVTAELYDPRSDEWRVLAEAKKTRLYHSTALLLPDGRVLVAGTDHQTNVNKPEYPNLNVGTLEYDQHVARAYEYEMEVFSPPYLFREIRRPVLTEVPERISYRESFQVGIDAEGRIEDLTAALLRPGAVTHGNNVDQRYVGLRIRQYKGTILLEAPPSPNVAPPGFYMLFVLDRGVPSESQFLHLDAQREEATTKPDASQADFTRYESNQRDVDAANYPPSAGIAVWLRADTGVVPDAEGFVQSWTDRSGQGNDVVATPNTPTDPGAHPIQRPPRHIPNELNGQDVVRFSLAYGNPPEQAWGGKLQSRAAFLPGTGPYSAFVVVQPWPPGHSFAFDLPTSRGPWGDLLGWGDFSTSNANAFVALRLGAGPRVDNSDLLINPGAASVLHYWTTQWQFGDVTTDPPISLTTPSLLEAFFDGVNTGIRMNGRTVKQDPAPPGGGRIGAGPFTIGLNGFVPLSFAAKPQNVHGAFYRGDIAEVLVYKRVLSDAERSVTHEYFRQRYRLWG
jgi:hypothetical protein